MDKFDQSTYQDAFHLLGGVNTDNPIIKLLNDPNTPVDEAKHHFDQLHEISKQDHKDPVTKLPFKQLHLYNHILHPPKVVDDEKTLDDEQYSDVDTFHDYVINSALESDQPHIFYTGAMSPLLKPKHLEKVVNSKFLEEIPQFIDMPHIPYSISPFEALARNKNSSLNSAPNHLITKLVDHAINHKLQFMGRIGPDSVWIGQKYHSIDSLIPKLNPQHMHQILDSGILNESNATTLWQNQARTGVFVSMVKHGDDNIRDRLLKEVDLPNENEDGSLGNYESKGEYSPNRYHHAYINALMDYGNREQKNTIITQLKSKNYKNPENIQLRDIFRKSNSEQRHYLIANFHPSLFDTTHDNATVGLWGDDDQKHHFIKRHNELNIKIPNNSYLRQYKLGYETTRELLRDNEKIKES